MIDDYTSWKASQARPWAEEVRNAVIRLEERERALDELRERADGLRATAYDKHGGRAAMTSGDDAMVSYIDMLDITEDEWLQAFGEWSAMVKEFERSLRMLNGNYDALLTARYIRGKKWSEVAELMCYSQDYLMNEMSVYALAALYDVMPMQRKAPIPRAD